MQRPSRHHGATVKAHVALAAVTGRWPNWPSHSGGLPPRFPNGRRPCSHRPRTCWAAPRRRRTGRGSRSFTPRSGHGRWRRSGEPARASRRDCCAYRDDHPTPGPATRSALSASWLVARDGRRPADAGVDPGSGAPASDRRRASGRSICRRPDEAQRPPRRVSQAPHQPATSRPQGGDSDLLRDAERGRPNPVWAAALTARPMPRGFMNWVAVLDGASRRVVAWRRATDVDQGLLPRGRAGDPDNLWHPGDRQHRPRGSVHEAGVHGPAESARPPDQPGRHRRLARPPVCGTTLEQPQRGGGVSLRLGARPHRPARRSTRPGVRHPHEARAAHSRVGRIPRGTTEELEDAVQTSEATSAGAERISPLTT